MAKLPTVTRIVRSKHDAQMGWPQDKNGASQTSEPQYAQQGALVIIQCVCVCVLVWERGGGGEGHAKYGKGEV